MRKIMKRGFCLFLVAVLLAGLVPCAFADEACPPGKWKHPRPQRRQRKKRRLHRKRQFPQNPPSRHQKPPNPQRQRKPRNRKRKSQNRNTGDEISGWHITVYADEACTQELRTFITGQDGTVGVYLEPGTYWVKETGSEEVRDDFWKMDDSVKKLVIRAHEKTTLEFINNYSGRISIQKTVKPEGTLEGWKFKITDADGKEVSGSPFTTDKDGKILTGNLTPGDYTVEEVLPADSLYSGEAPKTVTVTAGKTAEVSFLNKLRTGKITIRKVDTKDEPLAGATFLLEGSEDGSLWYPVIPGSNGVCTLGEPSEENHAAASKTSGEDGLLTWENLSITLQYRITETKAPEGYTLLKEAAFEGTLPADTLELQVVNGEAFALPKTGSTGLTVLPLAIIPCFSICAGAILYLRKREI